MLFKALPSARAADAMSCRTQATIASANGQFTVAAGVTATRLLSGRTIASSSTRSSPPHSPGPRMGGNVGAMASLPVKRSRQAEGSSPADGLLPEGWALSAGRERGSGLVSASADPQVITASTIANNCLTASISARIATLERPICKGRIGWLGCAVFATFLINKMNKSPVQEDAPCLA
jgi:hypothetical protein